VPCRSDVADGKSRRRVSTDLDFFGRGGKCRNSDGFRRMPAFGSDAFCDSVSGEKSEGRVLIFDLADVVAFDAFSGMSLGAEACGIEVRYGTVDNLEGPLFWTIFM